MGATSDGVAGLSFAPREIINRVKGGQRVEGPESFESVAKDWLKRHVDAKGLLSSKRVRRRCTRLLIGALGRFPVIRPRPQAPDITVARN